MKSLRYDLHKICMQFLHQIIIYLFQLLPLRTYGQIWLIPTISKPNIISSDGEERFSIRSQSELSSMLGSISKVMILLLSSIAAISLLVGGIGIMNIMLVSVSERTGEIGLRKAIGAREQDILLQFLIESTLVSIAGGAFGILFGAGAIVLVSSFTPLAATVSATAVALSLSVSTGIGLFFGVFPAYRASKLEPIVALRSV